MMQLKAQGYSDVCSEIDLVVSKPEAPTDQILNPECFFKEVVIKFQPSEDTLPNLFYASYFNLVGQITNGVITDVAYSYSSITDMDLADNEFDLLFGNSNNTIDMRDSIVLTIETDPGADFYLNVYTSEFYLQNSGGGMVTFTTCDRFESGSSAGVIYEVSPTCNCVPAMAGPDPEACGESSTENPGLEFFVDVANAIYDGQTAELPIKMRNVHASDTITLIRADFKIEMEDVYDNLQISEIQSIGSFLYQIENNFITVSSNFTSSETFELDSLESTLIAKIILQAPSNPLTGGEAIFDFLYARVLVQDINGYTGLNHCCKPPGIGDTIQVGSILPCQSPGEPLGFAQIKFASTVYSTNQLAVPVYIENLTNPNNDVATDGLTLEIKAITSGDLVLDSTAIANSLYSFPGCSAATIDIDTAAGTVSVDVTGSCDVSPGTNNLFKLFFTGTEGCVESITATIAAFDPTGAYVACVPPIQVDKPIPCFHQGEINLFCDTTGVVVVEGVQICKDSLGSGSSINCDFDPGDCEETETTGSLGTYSIKGDVNILKYRIIPTKEDDVNCGVTTFDLLRISKHILSVDTLDAAKRLAADVNNSGTISTADVIQIRKIILGTLTVFPDGPAWRFVPADYIFPDTSLAVPSGYPKCITYPDTKMVDFKAIKIGDINCSCTNTSSIQDTIEVSVSEVIISGGRKLEFKSSDFDDIAAFQFGFDFDSDDWVYEEEIAEDLPAMTSDAIGETLASSGNLKIAWFDTTGRTLSAGDKMLSLEFSDQPWVFGGSLLTELTLNETNIPALAYQEDGTPLVIRLVKNTGGHRLPNPSTNTNEAAETLVEVQPNPTNGEVNFNIHSSKSTPAQLLVFDTQGKKLAEISIGLDIGKNNYQLKEIINWPTGLYWYQIAVDGEILSGKIVKK